MPNFKKPVTKVGALSLRCHISQAQLVIGEVE